MKQTDEKQLHELQALLASDEASDHLTVLGKQIGAEALLKVLNTLGGEIGTAHFIPDAAHFIAAKKRELRNSDVCRQIAAGENPALMAEKYGLQTNQVMQIVEAQKEAMTA